ALKDKSVAVKLAAVMALGQYGSDARSALPPLRELAAMKNDKKLSQAARGALEAIAGKMKGGAPGNRLGPLGVQAEEHRAASILVVPRAGAVNTGNNPACSSCCRRRRGRCTGRSRCSCRRAARTARGSTSWSTPGWCRPGWRRPGPPPP